jgi:quercetin dioxygenase-like cupin family protein
MSNGQVAPETKGVTVKLLATVDLGPEIEGMAGRQLRMRMVTIEPGGIFGPIHDHKDRPGIVYILQGTITDHRNGVATDYGPGVGWPEDRNTTHWLENIGTIQAPGAGDLGRYSQARISSGPIPDPVGRESWQATCTRRVRCGVCFIPRKPSFSLSARRGSSMTPAPVAGMRSTL